MSEKDLESGGSRTDANQLRVVVVDDDPLARRMLRDVLQDAGVTVIAEAGGGREAIELSLYYKPDVVVMDLVMPGMDGIAATRQIVEKAPEIKVVMLTSSDS
jgi:two-component system, NarL family, response regulator LiaR